MLSLLSNSYIYFLSASMLGYLTVILLNLPAWFSLPLSAISLAILLFVGAKIFKLKFPKFKLGAFSISVLIIALTMGWLAASSDMPDADDFGFFRRALQQLPRMNESLVTTTYIFEEPQLSSLTNIHRITSYEPTLAFIAHYTGMDPLSFYQNGAAFVAGFVFILVYAQLFRQLSLSKKQSLVALGALLLFLYIDGNLHRSFGRLFLIRIWQGKAIFWSLILPYALLQVLKMRRDDFKQSFFYLLLAGVAAVGLTSSAFFLYPAFVFSAAIAFRLSQTVKVGHKKAVLIGLSAAFPILIALLFLIGVIDSPPKLEDSSPWQEWFVNVSLVIGGKVEDFVKYGLLLSIPPLVALRGFPRRFLILYNLVVIAIFLNPLFFGPLKGVVTSFVYWRFVLLLTIPLNAGLLGGALVQKAGNLDSNTESAETEDDGEILWHFLIPTSITQGLQKISGIFLSGFARKMAILITLGVIYLAYQQHVPLPMKPVSAYRFPGSTEQVTKDMLPAIEGKHVLAPVQASWVIGLLTENTTLVAERSGVTQGVFLLEGRQEEGNIREELQQTVTSCRFPLEHTDKVDVIILTNCANPSQAPEVLEGWKQFYNRHGYLAYKRIESQSVNR